MSVEARGIIENATRGWNRNPSALAQGTGQQCMLAALWTFQGDAVNEVQADPDADYESIAWQLSPCRAAMFNESRLVYTGPTGPRTFNIVASGVKPRAVIEGSFRILHAYLPRALLTSAAAGAEVNAVADDVRLIDPVFAYDPVISGIGESILQEMRTREPLSRLRIDALGLDLAVQLLRRHSTLRGSRQWANTPAKGGLSPWQLRRTTELLADRVADDVSLSILANEARLSTFHFARAFKISTGMPPHAYLTRLRLDRAKALLADTDKAVTEIALDCGYESSQALARLFQREVGCTPSAWRREMQS